ncbi:MAG: DoxX family protein, partial [Cyclobacteriaceae bacterium]
MRKYIDLFSRLFVGGLFIFSGLIKLNDPVGTQIKLEEYFEVFAVDFGSFFHVFIPWAMEIGMVLIILELALGFAVLLHYKMNTTMWVMLSLMVFFTFLTFYSAYFNKVTDCGCFGDAIKLTPWESFYKDVILMVFVLHLF